MRWIFFLSPERNRQCPSVSDFQGLASCPRHEWLCEEGRGNRWACVCMCDPLRKYSSLPTTYDRPSWSLRQRSPTASGTAPKNAFRESLICSSDRKKWRGLRKTHVKIVLAHNFGSEWTGLDNSHLDCSKFYVNNNLQYMIIWQWRWPQQRQNNTINNNKQQCQTNTQNNNKRNKQTNKQNRQSRTINHCTSKLRHLLAQTAWKRLDPKLGNAVGGLCGSSNKPKHRSHVHDAALGCPDQRQKLLGDVDHGENVDVSHAAKVLHGGHLNDAAHSNAWKGGRMGWRWWWIKPKVNGKSGSESLCVDVYESQREREKDRKMVFKLKGKFQNQRCWWCPTAESSVWQARQWQGQRQTWSVCFRKERRRKKVGIFKLPNEKRRGNSFETNSIKKT